MKFKSVYIVNGSMAYVRLFAKLGFHLTKHLGSASLVCFTGGEDVTPALYAAAAHRTTSNSVDRDEAELGVFETCRRSDIPMVGICRGGQFLNVASGGEMYQDVSNHCGDHEITDALTGETVLVSSTHHQMMKPSKKGLLVAYSTILSQREWFDHQIFQRDESNTGIEAVWYEHTKALCFQPHPEFTGDRYTHMQEYFEQLLNRYIFKD